MKRIVALALILIAAISLVSCSIPAKKPASGVWYCEELRIALDFDVIGKQQADGAWMYSDDGTVIPLVCRIDHGSGISFSKLDNEGNEVDFLSAQFQYKNDKFIINVHHMATADGSVVAIDDKEYSFELTEDLHKP